MKISYFEKFILISLEQVCVNIFNIVYALVGGLLLVTEQPIQKFVGYHVNILIILFFERPK